MMRVRRGRTRGMAGLALTAALVTGCGESTPGGPGPTPPPPPPPPVGPDLSAVAQAFEAILAGLLRDLPVAKALRDGMGYQVARAMAADLVPGGRPVGKTGEVCRWSVTADYWDCSPRPDPSEAARLEFELYEADPATSEPIVPLRPLGFLWDAETTGTPTTGGLSDYQTWPVGDGDYYPIYLVVWTRGVPGFELETVSPASAGLFTLMTLPDVPVDSVSWMMESWGTLDWEPVVPDRVDVTGHEDSGPAGGERRFRVEWSEAGAPAPVVEFVVRFDGSGAITSGAAEVDGSAAAVLDGDADAPSFSLSSSSELDAAGLELVRDLYLAAIELAHATLATGRQSFCALRRTPSACESLAP